MIKVLFFAHLRDLAQLESIEIPLGDMAKVSDLLMGLAPHVPQALIDELGDQTAMISVDHKYAAWDAAISDNVEVGILPPVSGG